MTTNNLEAVKNFMKIYESPEMESRIGDVRGWERITPSCSNVMFRFFDRKDSAAVSAAGLKCLKILNDAFKRSLCGRHRQTSEMYRETAQFHRKRLTV